MQGGEATLAQGASITVLGLGFLPGEEVTAVQLPVARAIGTHVADENGNVIFSWVIDAPEEIGPHDIVLTGATSGEARVAIDVVAAAPSTTTITPTRPSTSNTLPATGADAGAMMVIAIGLIVVGGSLRLVIRTPRNS